MNPNFASFNPNTRTADSQIQNKLIGYPNDFRIIEGTPSPASTASKQLTPEQSFNQKQQIVYHERAQLQESQIASLTKAIEHWRIRYQEKEQEVNELRDTLNEQINQQYQVKKENSLLRDEISSLKKQFNDKKLCENHRIVKDGNNLESLSEYQRLRDLEEVNADLRRELRALSGEFCKLDKQTDLQDLKNELEELQNRYNELIYERHSDKGRQDESTEIWKLKKDFLDLKTLMSQTVDENNRLKQMFQSNKNSTIWCC